MIECADFTISLPNKTRQLGLLHQPPEGSILQFCQDLPACMEVNINELGECVLLGNLNIYVNKKVDHYTITFLDTLESFGLQSRVDFPTH